MKVTTIFDRLWRLNGCPQLMGAYLQKWSPCPDWSTGNLIFNLEWPSRRCYDSGLITADAGRLVYIWDRFYKLNWALWNTVVRGGNFNSIIIAVKLRIWRYLKKNFKQIVLFIFGTAYGNIFNESTWKWRYIQCSIYTCQWLIQVPYKLQHCVDSSII